MLEKVVALTLLLMGRVLAQQQQQDEINASIIRKLSSQE